MKTKWHTFMKTKFVFPTYWDIKAYVLKEDEINYSIVINTTKRSKSPYRMLELNLSHNKILKQWDVFTACRERSMFTFRDDEMDPYFVLIKLVDVVKFEIERKGHYAERRESG